MSEPPQGPPPPGGPYGPSYPQQPAGRPPYPPLPGPGSPYAAPSEMSPWLKVVLGGLIGVGVGIGGMIVVLVALTSTADDFSAKTLFTLTVLVPMLLPGPLLFFRPTRMWAVGLMIGAGLCCVALAGTCALILTSLAGNSA